VGEIPLHHFPLLRDRPIPFEMLRIEWLPDEVKSPSPNRHTFYAVYWITAGAGLHSIDFAAYSIRPDTLFFVAPGQVHAWEVAAPLAGFILLFLPELFQLDGLDTTFLDELALFHAGESRPALHLRETAAAQTAQFVGALWRENDGAAFGQLAALQSWLRLLLIHAQRALAEQEPPPGLGAGSQLTRRFLRLVERHHATDRGVGPYAARLGVTAGHLTETIRRTTGSSAGAVIRRRIALEAQRLLAHSEQTAAEIAHALNFADPSYFGRFFKRETGQTPHDFRARFREKYQHSRE
jgi:AraC family transcriptional regulator, transcriptional activator of pobA